MHNDVERILVSEEELDAANDKFLQELISA